jgi:tetratricopeptide (TPR) repeat protein
MALKRLIGELHRRSLWQVVVGYLVFVWLLFETFEVLAVSVGLPDWVEPTAAIMLIVLFPALLATASIQRGPKTAWPRLTSDPKDGDAGPTRSAEPIVEPGPVSSGTAEAAPAPKPPRAPFTAARLFTWRNTVVGGAGAFVGLALLTAVYMILRTAGIGPAATLVAQGTLDDRERMILADFASPADLEELATAITEGMRVDLAQSPTVRIHSARAVGAALARMELEPDAELTVDLAREVAVREAVRGVVAGEISQVGSGFVIQAEVLQANDGSVLISQRATARNQDGIVDAVDELSKKIRERIGEPLASIGRSDPLERVTTANLEALRRYSAAIRAIDVEGAADRGQVLLEEAVGLDPTFAMAWRKLGVALSNRGEERRRIYEALEQAFLHRDRLTARERDLASAAYYSNAIGDTEAAIEAYQSLLEREPEEGTALNNLGHLNLQLRNEARAIPLLLRALEIDSTAVIPYMNLIWAYGNQGDLPAAVAHIGAYPWLSHDPTARQHEAQLHASVGDYLEATALLEALKGDEVASPYWRTQTSVELAGLAAVRGRLDEAEQHYRDAMASNEERGLARAFIIEATRLARMVLFVTGDRPGALTMLEFALAKHPLADVDVLDRPYLDLAEVYALASLPDRAQDLLDQFDEVVPTEIRSAEQRVHLDRARGAIAIASGDEEAAIQATRASDGGVCLTCALPQLGRAYEQAGQRDSAIAVYTRYVETPYIFRARDTDGWHLGPIHERLGQLYEASGDRDKAAVHYSRLVQLWSEADDGLQRRVEDARERTRSLLASGEGP